MSRLEKFRIRSAKLGFGARARIRVYRQLNRLLSNKVPLPLAIDTLWKRASIEGQKPNRPLAIVLDSWRTGIRSGKTLGESVAAWVPGSERMLLEAGETAGKLENALEDVVDIAVGTRKVRSALIGGLVYPVVLMFAIIGVLWLFGTQVVPAFASLLPPEQWTGAGATMSTLSQLVRVWTIPSIITIFLLIALYVYSAPRWTGKTRIRFDQIPPWSLYRMWQGLSFLLALSALVQAGVQISEILDRLRRDANAYTRERIDLTIRYFRSGLNIGESLHRTQTNFPDKEIVDDLRVYADLSGFEVALRTIAKEWLEESVNKIKAQTATLNTAMLFIFFLVILWMGAGFYSVQQQVVAAASQAG